ncbi:MAG: aldo/keto reductase [Bacillota bacterium]|nr:aldo/keto reductase [Bacillota bacterium]
MEYRELGNSKIRVSRICLGALTMGPLCADLPLVKGVELLRAAFEQGINFVDCAEQYRVYPYLSAALRETERHIVVSCKSFAADDVQMAAAVEDARIALQRDKLDIFLLHEVRSAADFSARAAAWQLLLDLKARGVIGAVGISTHSASTAAYAAEIAEIDVIHPLLNKAGVGVLDGGAEQMLAAVKAAARAGKGVYTMKALGGGALMAEAAAALKWAFAIDEIAAIAIGCRDTAELETNICLLEGRVSPRAAEIALIERNIVFDKEPRCHGCGACATRCASGAMTMEDGEARWQRDKCLFCGYCIAACEFFCISIC